MSTDESSQGFLPPLLIAAHPARRRDPDADPNEIVPSCDDIQPRATEHGGVGINDFSNKAADLIDLEARMRSIARKYRRKVIDPEDAAQEGWVTLLCQLQSANSFYGEEHFRAWLSTVVRNRLANLARRELRRASALLNPEDAAQLVSRDDGPAAYLERHYTLQAVRDALAEARDSLPELSHAAIKLRWLDGKSTRQVAAILGLSQSQVLDRQRRALPALRKILLRRLGADFRSQDGKRPV